MYSPPVRFRQVSGDGSSTRAADASRTTESKHATATGYGIEALLLTVEVVGTAKFSGIFIWISVQAVSARQPAASVAKKLPKHASTLKIGLIVHQP